MPQYQVWKMVATKDANRNRAQYSIVNKELRFTPLHS
jgi:hypothetical protein